MNSEFSFSKTSCLKAEDPSLPYYLPIAGERIIGFIPFPRVFVLCEMQWVSSRIWTRVAVSISYDNNHYTMGTSIKDLYISYCSLSTAAWQSSVVTVHPATGSWLSKPREWDCPCALVFSLINFSRTGQFCNSRTQTSSLDPMDNHHCSLKLESVFQYTSRLRFWTLIFEQAI